MVERERVRVVEREGRAKGRRVERERVEIEGRGVRAASQGRAGPLVHARQPFQIY